MQTPRTINPPSKQSGSMLLEALIAILIFSIGILGVVGMQASAIKASAAAKYRSDASMLANELIGQIWISNRTTVSAMQTTFNSPSGVAYTAWLASVQANLPRVASPNLPTVNIANDGTITISISWKLTGEPDSMPVHRYITIAQIQ